MVRGLSPALIEYFGAAACDGLEKIKITVSRIGVVTFSVLLPAKLLLSNLKVSYVPYFLMTARAPRHRCCVVSVQGAAAHGCIQKAPCSHKIVKAET